MLKILKQSIRQFMMIGLLAFSLVSYAAGDIFPFSSSQDEQRFNDLSKQYRCVVCQNQNLTDSNAPMAKDLRLTIYQKIINEESDEQILQFMVERYGDFVVYEPPVNASTSLLWLFPFVGLLLAFIIWIGIVRKPRGLHD